MRYTKTERAYHLRQQSVSGLTIKSYCEVHSINCHTFYGWRTKYADTGLGEEIGNFSSKSFIEVQSSELGKPSTGLNIYLPNGVHLSIDCELDAVLLNLLSNV